MHIGTDMQAYEHSRGRESVVRETENELGELKK